MIDKTESAVETLRERAHEGTSIDTMWMGRSIEAYRALLDRVVDALYGRRFRVTYVLHGWGIKEGYCVFGFEEATDGGGHICVFWGDGERIEAAI